MIYCSSLRNWVLAATGTTALLVPFAMRMTLLSLLLPLLLSTWCWKLALPLHLPTHSLLFNASKTQLIQFSQLCPPSDLHPTSFLFNGQVLHLSNSATHLGHILAYNLSDNLDIEQAKKDLICKTNCMLKLLSSFCLSLYGCALWSISSPELRSLETSFNNILRRIWSLPRMCHTEIFHCVAQLDSIYKIVIWRSSKLLSSAIHDVFSQSSRCVNTRIGYNTVYGSRHLKIYKNQ